MSAKSRSGPDWIFSTSLAGDGAKAEDSLSALGEEPAAEPSTVTIALVAIIDGKGGSRPPLTTLVLVIGTDRLRDVAGMHATDLIAEGGGIRPRPAGGRNVNTKESTPPTTAFVGKGHATQGAVKIDYACVYIQELLYSGERNYSCHK